MTAEEKLKAIKIYCEGVEIDFPELKVIMNEIINIIMEE